MKVNTQSGKSTISAAIRKHWPLLVIMLLAIVLLMAVPAFAQSGGSQQTQTAAAAQDLDVPQTPQIPLGVSWKQYKEMIWGKVYLSWIIVMIPIIFASAGFALLWTGLFPRKVEWTEELARRMPWGNFFFGLVITLALGFGAWALATYVNEMFALALIIAGILFFGAHGAAAAINWIGGLIDPSGSKLRRALLGAAALLGMTFIPQVGWLVPAAIGCVGFGAALVSWLPTQTAGPAVPMQNDPPPAA